jgi:hypothetical protein
LLGIGVVCPIYYFLHYVTTPIEKFKMTDMRLTRLNYSKAILPVLVLVYYLPAYAMFQGPTLSAREKSLFFWQLSPIWISLTGLLVSSFIPNTVREDRMNSPKRDLGVMRYTIGGLALHSAIVWIGLIWFGPYSFYDLFVPSKAPIQSSELVPFIRDFLKVDEISLVSVSLLWLAYSFWDIKYAGMVQTSWTQIVLYGAASIAVVGPGATVGLGWLWREDIITNKRHKDALTPESVAQPTAGKSSARKEK